MNLLHEFFNHKSDACPLEATAQEQLENKFQEWVEQRCDCIEPSTDTIIRFCHFCKKPVNIRTFNP